MKQTLHGWKLEYGAFKDKPQLTLSKPGRNTITIIGCKGIDPDILKQRAIIDALAQDVEHAPPEEKDQWRNTHRIAVIENRVATEDRAEQRRLRELQIAENKV